MRSFNEAFTADLNEKQQKNDQKIKEEHKLLKQAMLESFGIDNYNNLSKERKNSFDSAMSKCFNSKTGLTEKGIRFIDDNSNIVINESLTPGQKKSLIEVYSKQCIKDVISNSDLDLAKCLNEKIRLMAIEMSVKKASDIFPKEAMKKYIINAMKDYLSDYIEQHIKFNGRVEEGNIEQSEDKF